jgi:hypothetical protein
MNVLNSISKEFNKPILPILYRLVDRGAISYVSRNYPFRHSVQTGHGTKPASYPVDTESFFTGQTKWPERGGDHLLVPRLIMGGAVPPLPNIYYVVRPWHKGKEYFFIGI